jgi:hypothetical protein
MNNDMNNDNGVIGFCSFIENGIRQYGCRGTGKVYKDFYDNFIADKSYKFIGGDFPWSYFIFTDIKDEQKFLNKYRLNINFQIE